MPPKPLIHFDFLNAQPREKPYELSDGGDQRLLLPRKGSKPWRLEYRHLGAERMLTFGPYPTVSLADASTKRDEAKKLMTDGNNPRPSAAR